MSGRRLGSIYLHKAPDGTWTALVDYDGEQITFHIPDEDYDPDEDQGRTALERFLDHLKEDGNDDSQA